MVDWDEKTVVIHNCERELAHFGHCFLTGLVQWHWTVAELLLYACSQMDSLHFGQ